jgi:hypothetical protein
MSIEDLHTDLAANMEEAKNLSALSSMGDVVNHLKNTLWPFTQNVVGELVEMDQAIQSMYEQSEDILQFETGKLLASVIVGAQALVADLEQLVKDDPARRAAIKEWKAKAKQAIAELEEITLPEDAAAADDEDDDDDEAPGEDDEEGDDEEDGADTTDDTKKETAHA